MNMNYLVSSVKKVTSIELFARNLGTAAFPNLTI